MFSWEFYEIFKNTYFVEHLWRTFLSFFRAAILLVIPRLSHQFAALQLAFFIIRYDIVYFRTRVPDTSDTNTTRVRHEWKILNLITNENIFSQSHISYMTNERLQGEEQFHSKNYLLEMPCSHAKMRLKRAPQKLNFAMAEAISKSYTLDCSCKCPWTFPHSYA